MLFNTYLKITYLEFCLSASDNFEVIWRLHANISINCISIIGYLNYNCWVKIERDQNIWNSSVWVQVPRCCGAALGGEVEAAPPGSNQLLWPHHWAWLGHTTKIAMSQWRKKKKKGKCCLAAMKKGEKQPYKTPTWEKNKGKMCCRHQGRGSSVGHHGGADTQTAAHGGPHWQCRSLFPQETGAHGEPMLEQVYPDGLWP